VANILPYFEPLYPAIVRQCNLCGTKLGEDKFETVHARNMEAQASQGSYLFCQRCSAKVDDIARKVAHEGASLDAAHEKAKGERLREIAQRELGITATEAPGGDPSAPPREAANPAPPARASRNRPQGSIPNPNPR
jgi:hypothetical protein